MSVHLTTRIDMLSVPCQRYSRYEGFPYLYRSTVESVLTGAIFRMSSAAAAIFRKSSVTENRSTFVCMAFYQYNYTLILSIEYSV